ncbi:oxidoreductase FAD/NAD(P)-binding domain protein [Nitrosococcus halophilus Nc 4]|uniref:Oxidoreductase FAD/NAD(P)-binding domain protein n=1 Tax=Nitrosococcus halophilus (strain Nc4) TaxID=472759 RepID=D5C2C8_NITHN|nr:ferric reductase-like transmembrane domain-containing protein [Nitrosococcus halophilus]ADE14787.1 oxidoreductase FAD/NAD(P)-binding domain protein [Nitrosococcus halophilus Nc 4]
MKTLARALLWIGIYLVLVSAPLPLLLIGPVPPGAGLWWDFSMALGFGGMAIMGIQFALTARFRRTTAPFGIDIIYYFHRLVAIIGMGFLLLHFAILWVAYPAALGVLNPLQAPGYMTAGRTAFVLFIVVIVTSLWRKPLGINYKYWRILHALLATLAFILAVVHIAGVGYYTRAPWKQWLWIAYTLFWVGLVGYVRVLKPWLLSRAPYRVIAVRPERGQAWTVALEPESHPGMNFQPGQFAWLTLGRSPFRFEEHPFSFSSSAKRSKRLEFTIKARGDFTRTIPQVTAGEIAYVDGPYGVFSVDRYPQAVGFAFIAGGIGITPIMSMLRTLADRGDSRPLHLIYANLYWENVIFRDELEHLRERLNISVVHVIEKPPPEWTGERGRITDALLQRRLPQNHRELHYFLCGPKPMSEAVQRTLYRSGVPLAQVHFELFELV